MKTTYLIFFLPLLLFCSTPAKTGGSCTDDSQCIGRCLDGMCASDCFAGLCKDHEGGGFCIKTGKEEVCLPTCTKGNPGRLPSLRHTSWCVL